jgi:hypothetical protein
VLLLLLLLLLLLRAGEGSFAAALGGTGTGKVDGRTGQPVDPGDDPLLDMLKYDVPR